jgi:rfaE bifunctional protein nucleotidyltransferase chain/domain
MVLASFSFIDRIILFDEDTPYNLIQQVQPDILVKGADYKAEDIVGYDIVKAKGGKVVTIELSQGYSTTSILNKLKKS